MSQIDRINQTEAILQEIAMTLSFNNQSNIRILAEKLCFRYRDDRDIAGGLVWIEENWNKRYFPMWKDFKEAISAAKSEKPQYSDWQRDFARTLNMPVERFASLNYNNLSKDQKILLKVHHDILFPEERTNLFRNIRKNNPQAFKSLSNAMA